VGDAAADAAIRAITASSPSTPLPSDYPDDKARVILTFCHGIAPPKG
jgi:hypothetical protein